METSAEAAVATGAAFATHTRHGRKTKFAKGPLGEIPKVFAGRRARVVRRRRTYIPQVVRHICRVGDPATRNGARAELAGFPPANFTARPP